MGKKHTHGVKTTEEDGVVIREVSDGQYSMTSKEREESGVARTGRRLFYTEPDINNTDRGR